MMPLVGNAYIELPVTVAVAGNQGAGAARPVRSLVSGSTARPIATVLLRLLFWVLLLVVPLLLVLFLMPRLLISPLLKLPLLELPLLELPLSVLRRMEGPEPVPLSAVVGRSPPSWSVPGWR